MMRRLSTFAKDMAKPIVFRRRFVAYCVGLPKSGTNSIAGLFAGSFRSSHEPRVQDLIRLIIDHQEGLVSESDLRKVLSRRDRRLWLELESSHPLHYFCRYLAEQPEAKFVLTIRDCYSWLRSELNQQLVGQGSGLWPALRDLRYPSAVYAHRPEELALLRQGLPPVTACLAYWSNHIQTVTSAVPPERLLVLRTDQLSSSTVKLASFMGVNESDLDLSKIHLYSRPAKRFDAFSALSVDYIDRVAEEICSDVMKPFFPDIRRASDALSITDQETRH